jgi:ABC-type phosphate transport system substrate-binding protein
MRRIIRVIAVLCVAASLGGGAVVVEAASAAQAGNAVVNDCFAHGKLTHQYSKAELKHALAVMSSSVKQYSSCQSVIENALANPESVQANGTGGGGGSSISTGLIIVIVVVVLAIVTFGGLLIRRRRGLGGGSGS